MARGKCIDIRQTLTTLLPKAEIERLAHECGAGSTTTKGRCQRDVVDGAAGIRKPDASARWPVFDAPTNG